MTALVLIDKFIVGSKINVSHNLMPVTSYYWKPLLFTSMLRAIEQNDPVWVLVQNREDILYKLGFFDQQQIRVFQFDFDKIVGGQTVTQTKMNQYFNLLVEYRKSM